MRASTSSLPPIHDASNSTLPQLLPPATRVATPPPQPRVPVPPPSMLKFPSLVKPQHRIAPLAAAAKCNQDDESRGQSNSSSNSKTQQQQQQRNGNNGNNDDRGDSIECNDDERASRSSRGGSSSAVASTSSRAVVGDKNRDFIRELEEKKRKQREDEARKQRRKQKLHAKLSKKILEEAAQARQKQQQQSEQPEQPDDGDDDDPHERLSVGETPGVSEQLPRDDERESEDARQRRLENAKRQKRLLKKQQALLEQLQARQKEKQEEAELERERERRRQLKLKRAVLTAIYDANARCDDDEVEEEEGDEDVGSDGGSSAFVKPSTPAQATPNGPPLAVTASAAAGSAAALLRERREALAATDDAADEQQRQRAKEAASALQRKQHEYLARLMEQRRQKAKDEEDARALQERRKRKIQQGALLRHQEVARQQQENAAVAAAAAAAQREKDESAERAAPAVDVDAMVARLSRLKDRDAQVVPEARDFAAWKKRHGVRTDQSVFSVTGCYPVIREELERRGWYFNTDRTSPFFDLKWALKSDDLKVAKLEKHQYVNHFYQNTAITTKVGLLQNLRSLVWHQSRDIDAIFPRAYDLNEPRDMDAFVQDFRYGVAEGLLKELAKLALKREGARSPGTVCANAGVVDVLLAVARKKVRSKCPGSGNDGSDDCIAHNTVDPLDESIDNLVTPGALELVTDLEWEVLSKCAVDKPGTLRASLVYRKKLFADDRVDAALGVDVSSSNAAQPSVDTVLSALEKKQQRQLEKQRAEVFAREKARLAQLLSRVEAVSEVVLQEVVHLARALEAFCPQFRLNGGWSSQSLTAAVPHAELLPSKSLNIWIVKPAGMSRGRGIRVFNDLALLLEYADVENHKECQWVAQKYIENPLLVCRRKFDIRQWVLITSWDPLTVWFHRDCYLRFSSEEYSIDDLSDPYVHLTNNSIQKHSDKFHDVYATADGAIAVEGNMLHSDDFKRYLCSALGQRDDFWDLELQRRMKDIVVGSLQCVQDMVQHRANCCELFGYDFMVDTDLTPWLIEVNSSPACDYSTPTAERYVKTGLADIVKVIVDHREYEQKKRSGATGSMTEPDTGCWQRIHRGEYIGKPVSSFGADFFVKGAKVQKTRRSGASVKAAAAAAVSIAGASSVGVASTMSSSNNSSSDAIRATPTKSEHSGFVIVEEADGEDEEDAEDDDLLAASASDFDNHGDHDDLGDVDDVDDDNDDNDDDDSVTNSEVSADKLASHADGNEGQTEVRSDELDRTASDAAQDADVDPLL